MAGKVARDVTLLAQTEVGEVARGAAAGPGRLVGHAPQAQPGRRAVAVAACAAQAPAWSPPCSAAMVQEHERAAGAWHAEWRPLRELLRLTGSAAAWSREVLDGLEVDPARMRANLDAAGGLPMAEAVVTRPGRGGTAGSGRASWWTRRPARRSTTGRSLREALLEAPEVAWHLGRQGWRRPSTPAGYLGSAQALIDRALAAHG